MWWRPMAEYSMPLCCSRCLADQVDESWRLQAETRERCPEDAAATLVTTYWIDVPLCTKCYRDLTRLCWLFYLVGAMAGLVAAGLIWQFSDELIPAHMRDVPVGLGYVLLAAVGLIVTWGTGWALGHALVTCRLATYNPVAGQITFGCRAYQALFDEANRFMPKQRR